MITCKRCGKENQDHYKFCLGCGSELTSPQADSSMGMMKTMMADAGPRPSSPTPPGGAPSAYGQPLPGMAAAPAPAAQSGGAGYGYAPPVAPPPVAPPQAAPPPVAPPPVAPPQAAPPPVAPPQAAPPPAAAPSVVSPHDQTGPAPAPAPRRCSSCGADVPPGFNFCGVCGTPVEESPPPSAGVAPQPAPATAPRGVLTLIRPDGSEGGTHNLVDGTNKLGRDHGGVFENDGYLSPTHAEIVVGPGRVTIRDLDSLNGVFVRMSEEEEIRPGQVIRIGQELLRFDLIEPPAPLEDGTEVMGSPNPGYWGKITVIIGNDVDGSAFPLLGDSITLGRERGDINFPEDGYVSGLHARLSTRDGRTYLVDLGSSNGTFVKVLGERALADGDFALVGQQLFRLTLH